MLALSPLDLSSACALDHIGNESVLGGAPMLEDFNFDDLFLDFGDKDVMPGLEVEPELGLVDFLFDGDEYCRPPLPTVEETRTEEDDKGLNNEFSTGNSPSPEAEHYRKESRKSLSVKGNEKKSHMKKKGKVDWTPELHRRFVQAVEQLGIDKAVPSRILEIMAVDCLTRHNIASHLQKYRSHWRHRLAREAEAASWGQPRRTYAGPKREAVKGPWLPPTMGFPPPPPQFQQHPLIMPLHVWGHPTSPPPPPPPSHWIPPPHAWPHHYPRGPNGVTPGMVACYPRPVPLAAMRFPAVTSQHQSCAAAHHPNNKKKMGSLQQLQLLNPLPSKESVDAAIGVVLAKPWLPLPLGLKPPSLDGVLVELQRQGISNIPLVADLLPNQSVDL